MGLLIEQQSSCRLRCLRPWANDVSSELIPACLASEPVGRVNEDELPGDFVGVWQSRIRFPVARKFVARVGMIRLRCPHAVLAASYRQSIVNSSAFAFVIPGIAGPN